MNAASVKHTSPNRTPLKATVFHSEVRTMSQALTTEQKNTLQSLIGQALATLSELLDDRWVVRSLDRSATLTFDTDGLENPVTFDSNLYAVLAYSLHMQDEWGWNTGMVLEHLDGDECTINQNGLTFLSETLRFYEREFDCMVPEVGNAANPDGALYRALLPRFVDEVVYSFDDPELSWVTRDLVGAHSHDAVVSLIHQLEHGLASDESTHTEVSRDQTEAAAIRSPVNELMGIAPLQFGFVEDEEGDYHRQLMEPTSATYPKTLRPMATIRHTPTPTSDQAVTLLVTCNEARDSVKVRFDSLNEALLATVNRPFAVTLVWRLLPLLNGGRVDTVIEGCKLDFPNAMEGVIHEYDIPTDAVSDLMISAFNGTVV
jgi:hypothetical protein